MLSLKGRPAARSMQQFQGTRLPCHAGGTAWRQRDAGMGHHGHLVQLSAALGAAAEHHIPAQVLLHSQMHAVHAARHHPCDLSTSRRTPVCRTGANWSPMAHLEVLCRGHIFLNRAVSGSRSSLAAACLDKMVPPDTDLVVNASMPAGVAARLGAVNQPGSTRLCCRTCHRKTYQGAC